MGNPTLIHLGMNTWMRVRITRRDIVLLSKACILPAPQHLHKYQKGKEIHPLKIQRMSKTYTGNKANGYKGQLTLIFLFTFFLYLNCYM